MNKIGIRHETKYNLERRVAIVPEHVKELVKKFDIEVNVEQSDKRIFTEDLYQNAGAHIVENLKDTPVIFGVKEMPIDYFETNKTYIFFSHTVKGQSYNMDSLKKMMDLKCNLIDYEKVENENNKRLIFFGRFAGLAGMINSFWSLGQRLEKNGIDNPFSILKQAHKYQSLEEAKQYITSISDKIDQLPDEFYPLTIGITGYGNVAKGALEIAELLPHENINPEDLLNLKNTNYSKKKIYISTFKEKHISTPKNQIMEFDLQNYYSHPELYQNNFEQYVPHISILMNCMYWDTNYPRIITNEFLKELWEKKDAKLTVIGDVTCDPNGSIECTFKGTEIEDPVFVYNPIENTYTMGFEGEGILDMSVDILPSELPFDASRAFSTALFPFVPEIANANYLDKFEDLQLSAATKKAMILHKGELTPNYLYLKAFL